MRKLWVTGLLSLSLAGLGMSGEEAFADRRGGASAARHHGASSAQRHHNHSRPHHHHNRHHARPHHHNHFHSHSYGFWAAPIFIAPPLAYYYYPEPQPPVTYIERPPEPPVVIPKLNDGYWYYCPTSRVYYPYAVECTAGWQQVAPR